MLYKISKVLSQEHLKNVTKALDTGEFVDGKLTAGRVAKPVKNNLELSKDHLHIDLLNKAAMSAVLNNQEFQHAAMPARISTPIFAKYTKGMGYGEHIDDPIMGAIDDQYRSDVSITLFLNEPEDYTGGELAISTAFGWQKVKLKAGDMVVYPSSSIHQVMPVTKGERLVMVSWMQSMVRDVHKRNILYDLWQVREEMLSKDSESELSKKLDISYVNLVRLWSEPI